MKNSKTTRHTSLGVHFSIANCEWSTSDDLFAELDEIFHYAVDACALPSNAKCKRYFTPQQNALRQRWCGTVCMNPLVWHDFQAALPDTGRYP